MGNGGIEGLQIKSCVRNNFKKKTLREKNKSSFMIIVDLFYTRQNGVLPIQRN